MAVKILLPANKVAMRSISCELHAPRRIKRYIRSFKHPYMRYLLILSLFIGFFIPLTAQCPTATRPGVHVTQPGETFTRIAAKYNIGLKQLLLMNRVQNPNDLRECEEVMVPDNQPVASPTLFNSSVATPRPMTEVTARSAQPAAGQHIVQAGESIESLARLYGYSPERFSSFNNLSIWQKLSPGSVLRTTDCQCGDTGFRSTAAAVQTAPNSYSNTPVIGSSNFTARSPGVVAPNTNNSNSSLAVNMPTFGSAAFPANSDRSFLKSSESEMIDEINMLRANPAAYIPYVRQYPDYFQRTFGRTVSQAALNSLIRDLQNSPALSQLQAHPCLYQVAKQQGDYLRATGLMKHTDSRGLGADQRTRMNCPSVNIGTSTRIDGKIVGNENLVGGHDVRNSVISLLLDDGYAVPGHRATLLAPEWRYVAPYNYGTVGRIPNNYVQLFGR
ncbi:hypothetical protein CEQ90_01170 [Lewinellaceae bacterium SD302]|nr:hypothetical protein CEQ90_01170 [Lewinellaceae bacterium SD302]